MNEKPAGSVVVWDIFVRFFHWLLAAGVTIAAVTGFFVGATTIDVHVGIGVALGVLVIARVAWGFWGSRFARFATFVAGPRKVLHHIVELQEGTAGRHLGHNPLGAWMILTILATIAFLAVSGLIVWGGIFAHGPFTGYYDYDDSQPLLRLHWWVALGLLGLVALHVAGAIFEGFRVRENLVRAMITGFKQARADDVADEPAGSQKGPRPGLAVLVTLVVLAGPVVVTVQASRLKLKVEHRPPVTAGTIYAENCSDCHGVYSPTLLPAESWTKLMATLSDHFGEDASLDPEATAQIEAYLVSKSAGSVETKPSAVFEQVSASDPTRITASPFWVKTHRHIAEAAFNSKPVYSKGNCFACHRDAESGWFYPGNVEVPE